jgi:outer membrane protein
MKKIIFILSLLIIGVAGYSQENKVYLKEYIKAGLKDNLELQSAKEVLNAYDAKVSQASANFLPKVDISSRYTRAGGGRSFVFPLGSMLNPVYEALNFPTRLEDQNINFVRSQEHDTKVELIQPIFNVAVYYGYKAQDNMYKSASYEFNAKELGAVFSIKEAYYNYAKTVQLVDVQKSALALAKENLDVTTKLFKVDKAPKSDVSRAEVLYATSEQALQSATNQMTLAKNFFNNLLSRELESVVNFNPIPFAELEKIENSDDLGTDLTLEQSYEYAKSYRPELKQLNYAVKSAESAKKINLSDFLPNISLVADYGYQGEKYKFDKESDYWMVSGIFSWNIFAGFGSKSKMDEAEAQINSIMKTSERTRQLILLDVKNNFISLKNLKNELTVARKRVISAEDNYFDVRKRYEEGMAALISFIDAQTSLDAAKANYVVTFYSLLTQKAGFEKSIGVTEQF